MHSLYRLNAVLHPPPPQAFKIQNNYCIWCTGFYLVGYFQYIYIYIFTSLRTLVVTFKYRKHIKLRGGLFWDSMTLFCKDSKQYGCVYFTGDSGGPFMCASDTTVTLTGRVVGGFIDSTPTWTIHGIVSFGKECGKGGEPGGYVKVSRYLDWIAEIMNRYQ